MRIRTEYYVIYREMLEVKSILCKRDGKFFIFNSEDGLVPIGLLSTYAIVDAYYLKYGLFGEVPVDAGGSHETAYTR
jgi:hypothetical protein